MQTLSVVTTFHQGGLDSYAQTMLDSFAEQWPKDIKLYAYATELFEERIRKLGSNFRRRVLMFQLTNRMISPLISGLSRNNEHPFVQAVWKRISPLFC